MKNNENGIWSKSFQYIKHISIIVFLICFLTIGFVDVFDINLTNSWLGKIINYIVSLVSFLGFSFISIVGILGIIFLIIYFTYEYISKLCSNDKDIRNQAWKETKKSLITLRNNSWKFVKLICFLIGAYTLIDILINEIIELVK